MDAQAPNNGRKILIVKTFGLSQIIYNMQSYGFNDAELITVERIIFKIPVVNKGQPEWNRPDKTINYEE